MQSTDIEQYSIYIDGLFSKIVKTFNKLQLEEYSSKTITQGKELLTKGSELLNQLKLHTRSIETLLADCSDFIDEIREDMACEPKKDDYVFQTKNGMLGYPGKEFILAMGNSEKKSDTTGSANITSATVVNSPIRPIEKNPQKEEKVLIPEIGYYLKVHTINDLAQIPPAVYYYKSSSADANPPGLYMRMPNNNLMRIPFPEVVDSKKEYDRKHSIRCKYHTRDECDAQRSKMARMYNSNVRVCNFAHSGDRIVKIGYPSRCPSVPNFGNPQTMSQDIRHISIDDVKNLLMYSLSDLLTASVYLDYSNRSDEEFYNLDVC